MDITILNEIMESNLNVDVLGQLALELAEPIRYFEDNDGGTRRVIPRNQNYYEVTIRSYEGNLFLEHFRMMRPTFENLLQCLANIGAVRPMVIPFEKKVLFSIWVLSKPESFLAAGDRFGFARSTAHMVFKEVVDIIGQMLPHQLISWPVNHQQAINVFQERSHGFPGVVGAIDGSHIPIKQPKNNANDYYNRKEFHSIILQGVCDHRMLFIDVFIGMPGRIHDARVFRSSDIYRKLTNENNPLLPRDLHLLGDSAYPLMRNLLTPYRDNGHLNDIQNNYNYRMSSIRSVIERAFGRLKGKFRRLKYLDIGDPDFGTNIISAACVLHNFLILNEVEEIIEEVTEEGLPNLEGDIADEGGNAKRDQIANML